MSVLSSSFHKRRFKYGIFLSFRGEDTRTSFTDHLYSALTRVGIETFRDDKSLERGEDFAPDLLRAIGESWGSIIVFSEQYAFSHWCLVELVEIMKQREERGHRVYPIFYHVEPSDFRHQKNAVGEAFKEHERKYDNEKTQSWRRALQQVTGISGWPLKLDQHESAFVEGIVKEILEKLDVEILDEQEVIKLKSTYKRIQAVLRDAENKQYMKDGETVKVWFDELKHMAYDVEDVLDEWNTGILKSQIERDQAQTPSTSSSLSTKVHNTQNLFGGIALRIKELNKRLEATRVKDYFPLAVDINSITYPKLDQRPKTTSLVDESVVCGRDNDKRDLIDRLLLSDNNGHRQLESCNENVRHLNLIDHIPIIDGIKGVDKLRSFLLRVSSSSDSFSLANLGKLIHLRGELTIRGLRYLAEASEAQLSTMAGLRSLTLWFNATLFHKEVKEHKRKEEDALILQALHPPPHLHSLCIRFCQSPAYPNWMTSLTLLRSMELYGCFNWESLPPLGKLPLLESLTVKFLNNVKKVGEEFLGIETSSTSSVNHIDFVFFPNLKVLEFLSLHGWEEWEYEYEKQLILRSTGDDSSSNTFPVIMPKLQRLSVMHCPKLKALPHHLLRSRALQELTIIGSHILYERYDKEKGHDWPSISHFSQIEIWHWHPRAKAFSSISTPEDINTTAAQTLMKKHLTLKPYNHRNIN
ncbi:hypothetical protein COLO4_34932 [Corchorus olitorius]|uniref:TIR domain-containing protein n=1 Tax=Corchorus olitorius TaxID=93759 RepID=A0A1R3GIU6_9ROSI|nr:hypothetical protein COLO4_34932 [Corchorus olitorius]